MKRLLIIIIMDTQATNFATNPWIIPTMLTQYQILATLPPNYSFIFVREEGRKGRLNIGLWCPLNQVRLEVI